MAIGELTPLELAQINLTTFPTDYHILLLHAVVRRGKYWHTALIQVRNGKIICSTVNRKKFKTEQEARKETENEHEFLRSVFNHPCSGYRMESLWNTVKPT